MALTSDEIGNLTLAEVEAIATRYAAAVQTIRDAQALLGGGVVPPPAVPEPYVHRAVHVPVPARQRLNAAELAEKERLLNLNRGPSEVSPEIALAMRTE